MLLQQANAPIDSKTPRGLRVDLTFQEIITVETEIGRFTDANVGGVATDRTSEFDTGTKTLLPPDPLTLQNPGLSIPQFTDTGQQQLITNPIIGSGLTVAQINQISEETGVSKENLTLLDNVKQKYGLVRDKINNTLPDRLRFRLDNAIGFSRNTREFNIAISQLRQLPMSNVSAKQKFTIVLDGVERVFRQFWQPDDENWYVSIGSSGRRGTTSVTTDDETSLDRERHWKFYPRDWVAIPVRCWVVCRGLMERYGSEGRNVREDKLGVTLIMLIGEQLRR